MSLVEATAYVVFGDGIVVLTQMLVILLLGLAASLGDNLAIGAVFTMVSLARSYTLRRALEALAVLGRTPALVSRPALPAAAAPFPRRSTA